MRYTYQKELDLQAQVLEAPPVDKAPAQFVVPRRPDCVLLDILHRGHDGYITFHRQHDGSFEDLCSIPANALPGLFDQLVPLAVEDSYFSINGMFRTGYGDNRHNLLDGSGKLLKLPVRRTATARWLTCAYADLDCHKLGIDIGTAIGSVINAQDAGIIPPASVITRSGRGIWLFWLVDGRDYKQPKEHAAAYANCIDRWSAIQGALHHRLAKLSADAAALDVARICRIPGSINTKAKLRVGYWVQFDNEGKIPTYSLTTLADLLGVKQRQHRSLEVRETIDALTLRARKGQAGRWKVALRQFQRLAGLRHTFSEGTRNNAVMVYSIILRSLPGGRSLDELEIITEVCEQLRFDQKPTPFGMKEIAAAVRSSTRMTSTKLAKLTNQKISDWLDVTPEESAVLESWPPASWFGPVTDQAGELSQNEVRRRRRDIIKQRIDDAGGIAPSLDVLAEVVARAGLDRPALATVRTDLKALGIDNPRGHRKLSIKSGTLFA